MLILGQNLRFTTSGSISVPARNVNMIAPNPARKFTHCVISRPITLPAMAPTTISMSATETATRIEMMDASSASPIQTAEASQTFPLRMLLHVALQVFPTSKGGR